MIGLRILQLGCIGFALNVTAAHADRTLYLSTVRARGPRLQEQRKAAHPDR